MHDGCCEVSELCCKRPCDVSLACITDGFETCAALLPAQRIQVGNLGTLSQIITEHRNVNVFGKAGDQAESLGERCTALEQQAGTTNLQTVE